MGFFDYFTDTFRSSYNTKIFFLPLPGGKIENSKRIYVFDRKGKFLTRKSVLNGEVIQDTFCIGGDFAIPIGTIY